MRTPGRPLLPCAVGLLRVTLIGALILGAPARVVRAAGADVPATQTQQDDGNGLWPSLKSDIAAYFTAPVRWNARDWAWFAGAVAATGAAHHYDTDVRLHFIKTEGPTVGQNSHDGQDAAPTVVVFFGTWLYAGIVDSPAGRHEVWDMGEAAALSGVTAYALKYAAGREDPYQSADPNAWREGGRSFPSFHSTAAFAVGTVLAESGNDDFRWVRRVLGYGLGVATSYERLRHNAHWLSDTVAGAALGIASAHFVLNRDDGNSATGHLAIVPVSGGAMLTYSKVMN
jgi:membrane-associated phospholipid phosphatase